MKKKTSAVSGQLSVAGKRQRVTIVIESDLAAWETTVKCTFSPEPKAQLPAQNGAVHAAMLAMKAIAGGVVT